MKSIEEVMEIRNRMIENFESAVQTSDITVRESLLNFVIVGAVQQEWSWQEHWVR